MFWFGVIPLIIALVIRWSIGESVEWLRKGKPNAPRVPIIYMFRNYWKLVIIATMVIVGEATIYYGSAAYMPTFLRLFVNAPPTMISLAVLITNITWFIISPIVGYLSDRLMTRKVMLAVIYGMLAASMYFVILLLRTGNPLLIYIGSIVLGALFGAQYAILPAWLGENISTTVRYTYIAFVINLGVAISFFAPYLATVLSLALRDPVMGTAVLTIISSIIALIFILIGPKDRVAQELP